MGRKFPENFRGKEVLQKIRQMLIPCTISRYRLSYLRLRSYSNGRDAGTREKISRLRSKQVPYANIVDEYSDRTPNFLFYIHSRGQYNGVMEPRLTANKIIYLVLNRFKRFINSQTEFVCFLNCFMVLFSKSFSFVGHLVRCHTL